VVRFQDQALGILLREAYGVDSSHLRSSVVRELGRISGKCTPRPDRDALSGHRKVPTSAPFC